MVTTKREVRSLGIILSVWAHPDDESFACAGLLRTAVENGQKVVCLTATRGEKGVQDESRWPADRLAEIREKELNEALKILGVTNHHWLNFVDGECKDVPLDEAAARIAAYIKQYQPDTILTFGPEGMTGHDDHAAVSRWTDRAVELAGSKAQVFHAVQTKENYSKMKDADEKFDIFFNIDEPPLVDEDKCDILLRIEDGLLIKKYQCLCAQASQTEAMFKHFGEDYICQMISVEAFKKAS